MVKTRRQREEDGEQYQSLPDKTRTRKATQKEKTTTPKEKTPTPQMEFNDNDTRQKTSSENIENTPVSQEKSRKKRLRVRPLRQSKKNDKYARKKERDRIYYIQRRDCKLEYVLINLNEKNPTCKPKAYKVFQNNNKKNYIKQKVNGRTKIFFLSDLTGRYRRLNKENA